MDFSRPTLQPDTTADQINTFLKLNQIKLAL